MQIWPGKTALRLVGASKAIPASRATPHLAQVLLSIVARLQGFFQVFCRPSFGDMYTTDKDGLSDPAFKRPCDIGLVGALSDDGRSHAYSPTHGSAYK